MYQDDKIKNVSFSQPHVKWQFYCTEDFTKGQCNATSLCWYQCSSDRDVSVSCQQTHEHFIQVFNVIQLFTPPAPCPAPAQCEYNLVSHETWKLAWLAPAPARLGGSARLGAGSCCLGWKLSSPRLAPVQPAETPSKVWQWLSDQHDNRARNNFLNMVRQLIRRTFFNGRDFYKPYVFLRMSQQHSSSSETCDLHRGVWCDSYSEPGTRVCQSSRVW